MHSVPFPPRTIIGSETLTVDNTVGGVAFTATNYWKNMGGHGGTGRQYASMAFCTVEDQPVRVSVSGAPQAGTAGHEFAAGTSFYLNSADEISACRAIRTGGTSGLIHATFYA